MWSDEGAEMQQIMMTARTMGLKVFGRQQLGAQIEILKDYPNKAQNQTD